MPLAPPRRLAAAALALAVLVALPSCAKRPPRRFVDPNMDFGSVKTVAVLPFANLSRDALAGERVRDVFANMLLAAGAFYVMPPGEVIRAAGQAGVASLQAPNVDEVTKLGKLLKADAIFTGVVKEYGEVRSGSASGNAVSLSVQLQETLTGRVVWSASSTRGGISFSGRLLGGGGAPLNDVTEEAVDDLLDQLFK